MCRHCETRPATEYMVVATGKKAKAKRVRKAKANKASKKRRLTHEQYVASIVAVLLKQPDVTPEDRKAIELAKITYGGGEMGVRGITWYDKWKHGPAKPKSKAKPILGAFVGINATWQKSVVELAETVAHEIGHVTAGMGVGHGPVWTEACKRLGFIHARAKDDGTPLSWDWFTPACAKAIKALPLPTEGSPLAPTEGGLGAWGRPIAVPAARPCGAGWGTRGGASRGEGSKSRLLLWECACDTRPDGTSGKTKLRHAGRDLDVTCNRCKRKFHLVEESLPPAHTNGGPVLTKKRQRDLDQRTGGKEYRVPRSRPGKAKAGANPGPRKDVTKAAAKSAEAIIRGLLNPKGELPPGL